MVVPERERQTLKKGREKEGDKEWKDMRKKRLRQVIKQSRIVGVGMEVEKEWKDKRKK